MNPETKLILDNFPLNSKCINISNKNILLYYFQDYW